jgi:hypothetical protein
MLWRAVRSLVRLKVYPRTDSPAWPEVEEEEVTTATSTAASGAQGAKKPAFRTKVFQFFFGPPPPKPAAPSLPTYDSALRAAAARSNSQHRQDRRNGERRARLEGATGDAEDLEIERVRRMGGGPPAYATKEMRGSALLLRGPRPERPPSIWSRWSRAEDVEELGTPRSSRRASGIMAAVANFTRRLSARLSLPAPPATPTTGEESEKAEQPGTTTATTPPVSPTMSRRHSRRFSSPGVIREKTEEEDSYSSFAVIPQAPSSPAAAHPSHRHSRRISFGRSRRRMSSLVYVQQQTDTVHEDHRERTAATGGDEDGSGEDSLDVSTAAAPRPRLD